MSEYLLTDQHDGYQVPGFDKNLNALIQLLFKRYHLSDGCLES